MADNSDDPSEKPYVYRSPLGSDRDFCPDGSDVPEDYDRSTGKYKSSGDDEDN